MGQIKMTYRQMDKPVNRLWRISLRKLLARIKHMVRHRDNEVKENQTNLHYIYF